MSRLVTEWSTDDPQVAEALRLIASVPEWSIERLELEAALHQVQAKLLHEEIGARRSADRASERQRALRRGARKS